MKKIVFFILSVVFIVLALFENCFPPLFFVFKLPLVLCFLALIAQSFGYLPTLIYAFFGGLFADFGCTHAFGVNTVLYLLLTVFVVFLYEKILAQNLISSIVGCALIVFIYESALYLFYNLLENVSFISSFFAIILPRTLISMVLAVLGYFVIKFFLRRRIQ